MPSRLVAAKELSEILKVVSHPDRIRTIEELRDEEKDVNTLAECLELPGPRVSQHLSLLRAHRIAEERREGRHHFYHLTQPEIAAWITQGLTFVEGRLTGASASAIETARRLWTVQPNESQTSD